MTYVVTQNCCNDATCVDVCPVDCIHPAPGETGYETAEILHIDPATCIDCGACAEVCPVDAIATDSDLGQDQLGYLELSTEYFRTRSDIQPGKAATVAAPAMTVSTDTILRVAIVGTGPSAFYAADELLSRRDVRVHVTLIERLPFAGGLVRYGVAPDHTRTKAIDLNFQRILRHPDLTAYFGIEVGTHVSVDELAAHHHAVIFASGARADRRLGVPGEELPGSHSAREFVAWYNGHPDYADANFDLAHRRAVIVGNGNVALDVARILVSNTEDLRRTDIADHALDALSDSAVREVVIMGRRGAAQAACTTPELMGLDAAPGFEVCVDGDVPLGAGSSLKERMLSALASRTPTPQNRRIVFAFHRMPTEICGSTSVTGIRVTDSESGVETVVECGLVLRSIGYRGSPIAGLPFDAANGVISNDEGRVTESGLPRGLYVAGWIKRGPTGVIGTNRFCAHETVDSLLADHRRRRLPTPMRDEQTFRCLVEERNPDAFGAADWLAVDRGERDEGRRQKRPRVKLTTNLDVLEVVAKTRREA